MKAAPRRLRQDRGCGRCACTGWCGEASGSSAIRFLQETQRMTRNEAAKMVAAGAAEFGIE